MDFEHNDRTKELIARVEKFMDDYIYPNEKTFAEQQAAFGADRWQVPAILDELKAKAREQGLWNMFLPDSDLGFGLSNLEYAPLCEIMGRVSFASEVFNCSAPDTGNMEVLERYGADWMKEKYLKPLLEGEIRSVFCMTEPAVASSDATNIQTEIRRDGDEYVINGTKWWSSGALDPRCKLFIVMGKTNPESNRHTQQSQIIVEPDMPGVTIKRNLPVFGFDDAPHGHAEIEFKDVRVPVENVILGEGRGFEIAQGRLGPGRIHHCMRLIGCAQRALETMCQRVETRSTFGRKLSEHQSVREDIAQSFCDIEQARLLTMMAADKIDRQGAKEARDLIAAIKIVTPKMAGIVIDRAIQVHGAGGLTEDFFLAEAYNYARQIRFADGPDQVHMMQLGRSLVKQYA
ncbi:MAG TPA: acyl-CoA dehydrogenase [Alphaproteobacteria bacterium]|nr:acyl-CoA dehydrogenase [Alphaproteobacteria bacterium]